MEPEENGNVAEPELFPLDEAAIEAVDELHNKEQQLATAIREVNIARNAMLSYFLRQHKMSGEWRLADNRREMVRVPAPAPVETAK